MNTKRSLLILTLLLLATSLSHTDSRATVATGYTDVTVIQAKTMIDTNPSLVILDVRNQSEYVTGHIRNAILIPLFQLSSNLSQLNPNDEILVYCKAGGRSTQASQILVSNGFLHVYNMDLGIVDWIAKEYPVYVNYASIQEAINNAMDGSTLYVGAGEYSELLILNKSLNLIGENKHTTVIDGTSTGTVLSIDTDNASVSDFKIQYSACSCEEYYGIEIKSNHQNISITDDNIFSDSIGIEINKAQDIAVIRNNVTNSRDHSIQIRDSAEIRLYENNIADNLLEIDVQNSTHITIANNNLTNSGNGIALTNSNNNTVVGNIITSENPHIYGLLINLSDYNMIFHNSFQLRGADVSVHNSTDYWDNGFEGNYWSNYTGTDINNDGIGDTPFVLDANNTDNHPLMGPFSSYSATPQNDVGVITDSVIDNFEFIPPDKIRLQVSNTSTDQTVGFCRIIIPHTLIDPNNGTIQVIIDNNQTQILFLNTTLYDNGTHRWIYLAFPLSAHEIVIVPEYPVSFVTALVMVLVTAASSFVVVIERKKRLKKIMDRAFTSK